MVKVVAVEDGEEVLVAGVLNGVRVDREDQACVKVACGIDFLVAVKSTTCPVPEVIGGKRRPLSRPTSSRVQIR